MFFVKQMMKLEQIKVSQNMQMLYITSLKLSEFEDLSISKNINKVIELRQRQLLILPYNHKNHHYI